MSSFNSVTLVGNLARDPEVRATQNGAKIVNMTVVTNERWKDKNSGEQRERAEFHRVVIFDERLGEVAEKYLSKGRQCMVVGQLQTKKWTDKEGQERYSTEVVLQRFRSQLVLLGGGDGEKERRLVPSRDTATAPSGGGRADDLDDSIPFARNPADLSRARLGIDWEFVV